jgi:hypothetical protein
MCHKGHTLAKMMELSPPNMTFRRNLAGPWLVSLNELLRRLAFVQLTPGADEFG